MTQVSSGKTTGGGTSSSSSIQDVLTSPRMQAFVELAVCIAGIHGCYLTSGLLQEKIIGGGYVAEGD